MRIERGSVRPDHLSQELMAMLRSLGGMSADGVRNLITASSFTTLRDVPSSYTAAGGRFLRVTTDELGIEFATVQQTVTVTRASTANLTLSGSQVVDGAAVSGGELVLVKDQTNPIQNGVYVAAAGAWPRLSTWAPDWMIVAVTLGTTNGGTMWRLVWDGAIAVDTDPILFEMAKASPAAGTVITSSIADGAVTGVKLETLSPSPAGSYTNANVTVDAKGRVTAAANGSAGVGGSGTANRSARFSAGTTLATGSLYDSGDGRIGIGAASSGGKLHITVGVSDLNTAIVINQGGGGSGIEITVSTVGAGISLTNNNTGVGVGIECFTYGSGATIYADNGSSGSAMHAVNSASSAGRALTAEISATNNTATTIYATTQGTGRVGHFQISQSSNSGPAMHIETNGSGGCLDLKHTGSTTPSGTADWLIRGFNGTTRVFRVSRTGAVYGTGAYNSSGADFAEMRTPETGSTLNPGDVVLLSTIEPGRVMKAAAAASVLVCGVVSTSPGYVGGNIDDDTMVAVGVVGIVPCKVDDSGGAIAIGDLLVTSGATAGRGAKAGASPALGSVFAQAMEAHAAGVGTITVLLMKR